MKLLAVLFCVALITKRIFSAPLPSNDHRSSQLTGYHLGIPSNTRLLKLSSKNICHLSKQDVLPLKELRILILENNCIRHLSREVLCEMPKLQRLMLKNNKIENLENGTFSCLKSLEVLDLSNNYLSKLEGNVFAGLHKLFSLYLGGNRLTRVKNEWFSQLPSLSNLNMQGNQISVLEENSFNGLSLMFLKLNENRIRRINPNAFKGLSCKMIDLGNNLIDNLHPGTFSGCKYLNKLQLSNNKIKYLHKNIFSGLTPWLQILRLDDNEITTMDNEAFLPAKKLRVLSLNRNNLTKLNRSAFKGLSLLHHLYLKGNKLKDIEKDAFRGLASLRILDISENLLTGVDTESFRGLRNLNILTLRSNHMRCSCELIKSLISLDINWINTDCEQEYDIEWSTKAMWSSWEEISTFDDNIEHNQKKFESRFRSCRRTPPSRNNILEYPGMNISTMTTRVDNNISRFISFVLHKKSSSSLSVIQREESPRLCSVMGCCKVHQRSVMTNPWMSLDEKQEWRNQLFVGGDGIMLYYRSDYYCGTDNYLFIMVSNIISGSFIQCSEEEGREKVTQYTSSRSVYC